VLFAVFNCFPQKEHVQILFLPLFPPSFTSSMPPLLYSHIQLCRACVFSVAGVDDNEDSRWKRDNGGIVNKDVCEAAMSKLILTNSGLSKVEHELY
jgi:hypothetical protein